jgi:phosphoribosylamine--glycine ligase
VKVGGEQLHSFHEAYQYCEELLLQGQTFVIEEKLIGQEFTLLCFCDGLHLIPMPLVQDHKRAYNNDEGPNTGGMGSYSFANHRLPFLSDKDIETAQHINQATMTALTAEYKEPYIGILYGSFMATKKGVQLIEFNARFGDPEALNVLAILDSDFLTICEAMIAGNLSLENVRFANLATVCKYVVPEGYPDNSSRQASMDIDGVKNPAQLYLAGVDEREDTLYLTGSRTAAVVGVADTIIEAEQLAEADVCRIQGPLFHREDIGTKELINRRIRQMQELRQQDFKLL